MNKLELNTEVYSIMNIKNVIEIYKNYADICIKDNSQYVIVCFDDCKYDCKTTMKEFENYLIGLENVYENS